MPRLGLCVLQQRVHGCIRLHVNGCIPCTHSMASHIHKLQARVSRTFAWFAQCANRPRGYRARKNLQYIGFSPAIARDERFRLCTTWARPYADRKYASSSIHPCKATACVRNVRCGWSFQMEAIPNSAGNVLGTNLCTQGASAPPTSLPGARAFGHGLLVRYLILL